MRRRTGLEFWCTCSSKFWFSSSSSSSFFSSSLFLVGFLNHQQQHIHSIQIITIILIAIENKLYGEITLVKVVLVEVSLHFL